MTEVWKSNARKFCEICKVWFADNRVSIEHHEAGQKHKAAIQAKLRELGQQSKAKEQANAALEATLAMMESAAMGSMKSRGESSVVADLPCGSIGPMPKPRQYLDPRAHQSSVTKMAKEMARRNKEVQKYDKKVKQAKQEVKKEVEVEKEAETEAEEPLWVENITDEGVPYYFHMYSGETTWQMPSAYLTADQYVTKLATLSATTSDSDSGVAVPQTEVSPGGETDSSGVPHVKQEADLASGTSPTADINSKVPPVKLEPPSAESIAMAANFRLEDFEIPLPPPESCSAEGTSSGVEKRLEDDGDKTREREDREPNAASPPEGAVNAPCEKLAKVKEEVDEDRVLEETNAEENLVKVEPKEILANGAEYRREQRHTPYGAWKRVEKAPEPPKIDLELPDEAGGRRKKEEVQVNPGDIVVFTEKTAPVLKKKKNLDVPVEFKKRKTNLSIRQRKATK